MFGQTIKSLSNALTFMNGFERCMITSLRFVKPVAKFKLVMIVKISDKFEIVDRKLQGLLSLHSSSSSVSDLFLNKEINNIHKRRTRKEIPHDMVSKYRCRKK